MNQPAAADPQRDPHRKLVLTRERARQHQAAEVDASDRQERGGQGHDERQRGTVAVARARKAAREGVHRNPLRLDHGLLRRG